MDNVNLKQFKRTFSGGFSINFPQCFNNIINFKHKNHSNFYLSDNINFSSAFEINDDKLKSNCITTELKYGQDYLQFSDASEDSYKYADRYRERFNYGEAIFSSTSNLNTRFVLEIFDDNVCRLYFLNDYKRFYLACDVNNKISFVLEKLLPNSDAVNPHDFEYMFSETENKIVLFKRTSTQTYVLVKYGNSLIVQPNVMGFVNEPFKLSRSIFIYPHTSQDTSFITYTNDNNVDMNNSVFNLHNNLLLHRSPYSSILNAIVLKNQLLQNDIFSCGNTLISGGNGPELVDNIRNYTVISEDIKEETTDELELNYVFYNQSYKITPGTNLFVAPSSLNPFSILNINDTKFISSGAFSYNTPQYADKIYHLSDEKTFDGQYLLCTWLSGAPDSSEKIWVDRYYYPDLIEKEEALQSYPSLQPTYDDYVEQLIIGNSELADSIEIQKFFDKKSDLVFIPNDTYIYDRIDKTYFPSLTSNITYCTGYSPLKPINYFTLINESNQFSLGFYFSGDSSSWTVKSERNNLDCGLTIEKNGQSLVISYQIYDNSTSLFFSTTKSTTIKNLKNNFIFVAIDAITGTGYFFLNNEIISEFILPPYQFVGKPLLYGDFFIYQGDSQLNLLASTGNITLPFVQNQYIESSLAFIKPMLDGKANIDDIYITLPCGMRNSADNLEYLQSACGSSMFKSNTINVLIKNLNIDSTSILSGLSSNLITNIDNYLPVNTTINNIQFENYQ